MLAAKVFAIRHPSSCSDLSQLKCLSASRRLQLQAATVVRLPSGSTAGTSRARLLQRRTRKVMNVTTLVSVLAMTPSFSLSEAGGSGDPDVNASLYDNTMSGPLKSKKQSLKESVFPTPKRPPPLLKFSDRERLRAVAGLTKDILAGQAEAHDHMKEQAKDLLWQAIDSGTPDDVKKYCQKHNKLLRFSNQCWSFSDSPNARSYPLHYVLHRKSFPLGIAMLESGANPMLKDSDGLTAIDHLVSVCPSANVPSKQSALQLLKLLHSSGIDLRPALSTGRRGKSSANAEAESGSLAEATPKGKKGRKKTRRGRRGGNVKSQQHPSGADESRDTEQLLQDSRSGRNLPHFLDHPNHVVSQILIESFGELGLLDETPARKRDEVEAEGV